MNIWLLHPFAGGPGLGRHWRPYWLADAWNRMGHRTTVICPTYQHQLMDVPRPEGLQTIGGVDFRFVGAPRYSGNGIGRLLNSMFFGPRCLMQAGAIAEASNRPDLIIASSPHLFHVAWARRIARRFNARFFVEVRDLWPASLVELKQAGPSHPLVHLLALLERSAYRNADRIVSLLANAEPYMQARGLGSGRFRWIPNGISETEVNRVAEAQPVDHPLVARMSELRARGKELVVYAGAMGPPNALETLVDAAARLASDRPDIHFVLIGSGVSRGALMQRATHLGNVEFAEEVDRPIAQAVLGLSSCAVLSLYNSPLFDLGISPNKLFDYCLCAPRTLVTCSANALSGLEELVTLRCTPGDVAALADALPRALARQPRSNVERISLVQKFSYSELAARYLE